MRTTNIVTGGTIVGLLGISGLLLTPGTVPQAAAQSTQPPPPDKISLTGHIRDFPPSNHHVDFQVNPSATPGAKSACNVVRTLRTVKIVNGQAEYEYKPTFAGTNMGRRVNQEWRDCNNNIIAWCQPRISVSGQGANQVNDNAGSFATNIIDQGGISSTQSFAQWFRDVPGINMSRLWTIHLELQSDGSYLYDTNNFNPIDHQLFGNGQDEQNFYFTYEIVATFTAAPGQFLEFRGDDDFWAFIVGPGYEEGELVLDHGGIAANRVQRVNFNRYYPASSGFLPGNGKMVVGQEYKLHLFFAERCQPQSQFRLMTNIGGLKTVGGNSIFAAFD